METLVSVSAAAKYQEMQAWPHWDEIGLCYAKEFALSQEEFHCLLPEYQKFMALCMVYDHIGMVSPVVDRLWHAHILHTALYSDFCVRYHGSIIHHLPCSSYRLYGITDDAFLRNECSSCKKVICSVQTSCYGAMETSIAEMRQGILISASQFRFAYEKEFGPLPAVWKRDE